MRTITRKIILVAFASCATLSVALGGAAVLLGRHASREDQAQLEAALRADFDRLASSQVETAATMLQGVAELRDRGELEPREAERIAAHLLRGLRYGGEGYFWADTLDGTNVVLLGREAEGKNRLDAVDARGTPFIRALRERAQAGGGFTEWWFPKKGGGAPMPKRGYSTVARPFGWVIGTGNYLDEVDAALAKKRAAAQEDQARQAWVIALVSAALLALGVGLAVALGRRLAAPLLQLTALVRRMGEGDFAEEDGLAGIARAEDETGRMARALQAMRTSVGAMVRGAQETSDRLAGASAGLARTAAQMSGGAGSQASAVQQVAASVHEIAQSAERGAAQAAAVVETARRSEALLRGGEEALEEVRRELQALGGQVEAQAAATGSLVQRALQIDDIARSVKDVAEQSHVLAVNASLEAARAGAAGRGFAVVAQEVRALSARSLQASEQVRRIVKEIVEASQAALRAGEEGSGRVAGAVAVSQTTDGALRGLGGVVRDVTAAARDIADGLRQQNEGVQQVSGAMAEVSGVTQATVEVARDVEQASAALAGEAAALRGAVQRFRT